MGGVPMSDLLDSFVKPKEVFGKDLRPGYYFYCAFPKKYGEPNMSYIKIIKIETWGNEQKVLWFNELKPAPMIVDNEKSYLVKMLEDKALHN